MGAAGAALVRLLAVERAAVDGATLVRGGAARSWAGGPRAGPIGSARPVERALCRVLAGEVGPAVVRRESLISSATFDIAGIHRCRAGLPGPRGPIVPLGLALLPRTRGARALRRIAGWTPAPHVAARAAGTAIVGPVAVRPVPPRTASTGSATGTIAERPATGSLELAGTGGVSPAGLAEALSPVHGTRGSVVMEPEPSAIPVHVPSLAGTRVRIVCRAGTEA
jgi:hypothetical protein